MSRCPFCSLVLPVYTRYPPQQPACPCQITPRLFPKEKHLSLFFFLNFRRHQLVLGWYGTTDYRALSNEKQGSLGLISTIRAPLTSGPDPEHNKA